eukprot:9420061-Pyramimonas_sp.AAC.1
MVASLFPRLWRGGDRAAQPSRCSRSTSVSPASCLALQGGSCAAAPRVGGESWSRPAFACVRDRPPSWY